jgi:hypothetical protein
MSNKNKIIELLMKGQDSEAFALAGILFNSQYNQVDQLNRTGQITPSEYIEQLNSLRGRLLSSFGENGEAIKLMAKKTIEDYLKDFQYGSSQIKEKAAEIVKQYAISVMNNQSYDYATAFYDLIKKRDKISDEIDRSFVEMVSKEMKTWADGVYDTSVVYKINQWYSGLDNAKRFTKNALSQLLDKSIQIEKSEIEFLLDLVKKGILDTNLFESVNNV